MLKLIGIISMLIDHIGVFYADVLPFEVVVLFRIIGRIAFPVFAFSLARGFYYTSNRFKYLARLFIFAVMIEFLLRFGLYLTDSQSYWSSSLNILFTLSFGIVALFGLELFLHSSLDVVARLMPTRPLMESGTGDGGFYNVRLPGDEISLKPWHGKVCGIMLIALALIADVVLHYDYSAYGVLTVLCFAVAHESKRQALVGSALFILLNLTFSGYSFYYSEHVWSFIQCSSIMALGFCYTVPQSQKAPNTYIKYFFYIFYPTHLLVLMSLRPVIARLLGTC